jgi:hypothetical protein
MIYSSGLRAVARLTAFCLMAVGAMGQEPAKQTAGSCGLWNARVSSLPPSKAKLLARYGIVWDGDLLVSERFDSSCEFRVRVGEYWGRRIAGDTRTGDATFGSVNSAKICLLLRTIWPVISRSPVGDGEFDSDRFNLLSDPNLNDTDLGRVLGDVLGHDHIGPELSFVLFSRPMTRLRPNLWGEFRRASNRKDFRSQIYSLSCLDRTGEDVRQSFERLSSSPSLTERQRKFVRSLVEIVGRRKLEFGDIEPLEYEDLEVR